MYSCATAACGLAQSLGHLIVARLFVGLGMGGEWATGAALVAETWPAEHRGKALGVMQSAWAVGYAMAAGLNAVVLPRFGWRAVFFAGLLPALVTLWIRHTVAESPVWTRARATPTRPGALRRVLLGDGARITWTVAAMNAATMFAWWGLFSWLPTFLGRPVAEGGAGLSVVRSSGWIVLMQVGMWCGYVTFGVIADRAGRKRTYVAYLLTAAVLVPIYAHTRAPTLLLVLGPLVAFFGTGYFSGFGGMTAELFPTAVRATAQGLTYNLGRGVSACAPVLVGSLAGSHGLSSALTLTSAAFLLAAALWRWIPETSGRPLPD
jgi:MFS family permease